MTLKQIRSRRPGGPYLGNPGTQLLKRQFVDLEMPDKRKIIYWDACVFLSYVNEYPDRAATLESLLDSAGGDGATKLYTSTLSHVEVSFGATEQQNNALDHQTEQRINSLWDVLGNVISVEFHQAIAQTAKALMREAITRGWSLRPADAIHLATAKWLADVDETPVEFQTYDDRLQKFEEIVDFTIVEPYTDRPKML